jgi:hypothetical protein
LLVSGNKVLDVALKKGWGTYTFIIPRGTLRAGMNYLNVEQTSPPIPTWPIGTSGHFSPVEITVRSVGRAAGRGASFQFGQHKIVHKNRGLIAYVIDATDSAPRELGRYWAHRSSYQARQFIWDVDQLPQGSIVALSVSSEAGKYWIAEADRSLKDLGGTRSLVGASGASYALVGVKGASKGQALEVFQKKMPAQLDVGRKPSERANGVALGVLSMIAKK